MPDLIPNPLDSWQLLSVRTPETEEQLVSPGGCSASVLTHEAQWMEGEDPETGEPTSNFVGPVFHGSKLTLDLERRSGAGCGCGVVAFFDRGGSRTACGVMVYGGGTVELVPREPGMYAITLCLSEVPE